MKTWLINYGYLFDSGDKRKKAFDRYSRQGGTRPTGKGPTAYVEVLMAEQKPVVRGAKVTRWRA